MGSRYSSAKEKVKASIQIRLGAAKFHKEALRAGIPTLAAPSNALTALRLLYDTVDNIWFAIGDSSVDFNFYTKRTLLAGVYGVTLLYWLDDDSDEYKETWKFLKRRLDGIIQFGRLQKVIQGILPDHNMALRTFRRF